MAERKKFLFTLLIILFTPITLMAQDQAPSLEPLFVYQKDFSNSEDIIAASLLFSQCDPTSPEGKDALDQYKKLENIASGEKFKKLSSEERGEAILELMYESTLLQYETGQNCMNVLFNQGTYNCASSSMLYLALTKAAGLNVKAQQTPDHLFCTLITDDNKRIDVETTSPKGFNPGSKKIDKTDKNRYAIVPKENYLGRKEVSDRYAVSLIGKNEASKYMNLNDYERAVPIAAARVSFMEGKNFPEDDSREILDLVCINRSIKMQNQGMFFDALVWLDKVYDRWGKSPKLQESYDRAVYNCIADFCNANDYAIAEECYEERKNKVSQPYQNKMEEGIFLQKCNYKIGQIKDEEEAIAFVKEAKNHPMAKKHPKIDKKLTDTIEYLWVKKITNISSKGDHLKSAKCAERALADFGESVKIRNIRKQCLYNYDVTVHNEYAKLANSKKFEEAKKVLEKGLKEHPDSNILKKDLNQVKNKIK